MHDHVRVETTTEKLLSLVPNLEVLDLKNAKKVSHQFGLRDWSMPRAPQLRAFSYGWAYDVSTAHILNIVRGRTKLESLSFDHLEGMMHDPSSGQTDELLVELGASCPNLTRLEITGHLEFTDVGVRALLGGCTKLKTLKLDTRTIFHQQASRVVLGASSLGALTASIATHGLQVAITGYAYDTTSRTFGEGNVNKRAIDVD